MSGTSFNIDAAIADEMLAKFTPAAANAYVENLELFASKIRIYAEDSNTNGGAEALETINAVVARARDYYPKVFAEIANTISTIKEGMEESDTMH